MSLKERLYSILVVSAAESFNASLSELPPKPIVTRYTWYQASAKQKSHFRKSL